ncbi:MULTISPECIES: CPBP family intramembrane glutamic endopeptidase [unclassified Bacillus cereus group]|uniref:CPBP family intramembrane glutamic endopeptidase n=1 Tax=unclassified Bacillus cereus group TaxID=2750818 RepID=UPI001F5616E6|nr:MULTISPECIES: CPBP family intramembrane glutamic endopeptidase [unclassified Bacillus cereus group]
MVKGKRGNVKVHLIVFIIVVLISGWLGVLLDSVLTDQTEGNTLGMGLWLVLPFLTATFFRIIRRDWKDMGLKLNVKNNVMWYVTAFAIYPFVTLVSVGFALFFGAADISHVELSSLLSIMMISMASNFLKNIFEEFAWRGYLTPKLIELKMNDWLLYLISGLIWALWHSAYYIVFLPNDYFESTSRMSTLLIGCVLMVCWTVMYVEIYRLTKSVWPCVCMHALEDAVPTVLVTISGVITFTDRGDFWLNPVSGVVATGLFLSVGLFLRAIRIKRDNSQSIIV